MKASVLSARLRHYRDHYPPDRLRLRLIEDGFDPEEVDAAMASAYESRATDAYGAPLPETNPQSEKSLASYGASLAVAAVGVGVDVGIPITLALFDLPISVHIGLAALCVLAALQVWGFARTRYDYPSVSRGLLWSAVAGPVILVLGVIALFILDVMSAPRATPRRGGGRVVATLSIRASQRRVAGRIDRPDNQTSLADVSPVRQQPREVLHVRSL